jgi:nitrite reductase/ring-hydroxylating ferredoxin subunit
VAAIAARTEGGGAYRPAASIFQTAQRFPAARFAGLGIPHRSDPTPAGSPRRSVAMARPECVFVVQNRRSVRRSVAAGQGNKAAHNGRRGGMLGMAEKLVGKLSEFKDGDRRIVFIGDHEIGVFHENGSFYAYSNYCLHQGGPACEGLTIAKVEERIMPDKTSRGMYFSDTELHFVCPWHGYEYDIKTGECVSDRKLKLRKYDVVQRGDEVYVRT